MAVRIIAISDTHGKHHQLQVPDGDILIHAGDMTCNGTSEEIASFNTWLGSLKHSHKLVCAGNHDFLFERSPLIARTLLSAATYLEDSMVDIFGLKFFGSPWQPRIGDWAFSLDKPSQLRQKWRSIPQGVDVLITHSPPFGILDLTEKRQRRGCEELLQVVKRLEPKVHIFGHSHFSNGQTVIKNTLFANAAICDEHYRLTDNIHVIDLP